MDEDEEFLQRKGSYIVNFVSSSNAIQLRKLDVLTWYERRRFVFRSRARSKAVVLARDNPDATCEDPDKWYAKFAFDLPAAS